MTRLFVDLQSYMGDSAEMPERVHLAGSCSHSSNVSTFGFDLDPFPVETLEHEPFPAQSTVKWSEIIPWTKMHGVKHLLFSFDHRPLLLFNYVW